MNLTKQILFSSFKKSAHTSAWLLKIILPISLLVRLVDYWGVLTWLAHYMNPVFIYLGLPGSTAIVFITSIFLPLYAPLAIIASMNITLRELTILALMCQTAHNLPVESAIQAQTGASFLKMSILRVTVSLAIAIVLNLILPKEMGMPLFSPTSIETINSIPEVLLAWLKSSLQIGLLILAIVFGLNVLYQFLLRRKLIDKLSRSVSPLLRFFGLPENTAFLWLIGYIVGLAYGGALMKEQMKDGRVSKSDAETLNYHLAVSHSVLEDNLLFVALGVSFGWILSVRLAVAWIAVWTKHLLTGKSYKSLKKNA